MTVEARRETPAPALDAATSVLSSLLEARTGQRIAANRAWRLDTTLKPVMRERGFDTPEQLVAALLDGQDRTIADRVIDALLNQETSFFRDVGVLEAVVGAVDAVAVAGTRPRIWSAGCSTGQEPLSLAMLLAERAEASGAEVPDIVATDVSEGAITRARAGRYTQFEIQRGLPVRRMIRWFDTLGEEWLARPELVRHIAFRRHNLVADAPPPGRFDAILCRNVLIYLAPDRRRVILDRMAAALRPGGVLVLGAGETVIGQSEALVPSKRFRGFYEGAARARRRLTRFTLATARGTPGAMIEAPSPNFDARALPVTMIVLHYTGMPTAEAAIARLRDPAAKVSAHYVVAEDGTVLRLVDEANRAWHAGRSHWREIDDVNSASVGIEIVNPGHEFGYRPFPDEQVAALIPLVDDIKARHGITRGNVVGHSDIAPTRKRDPGELFPWSRLARLRLALPRPTRGLMDPFWTEAGFLLALERFGYEVTDRMAAIMAFQRRFRPELIDGEIDAECRMLLLALLLPKPQGDA